MALYRYFLRFVEHAEKHFAREISAALQRRETTAFAVEREHSLPEDSVRSVLRGAKKSGTTLNKARAICEALGLEFYIGPPRSPSPAPATTVAGKEFDTVARHDAFGSAGGGMINFDGPPIDHLAFSKRWLEQNGISAGNCVLINVKGDSMEPAIYDGDLIMIDRRKKHIQSGRIYVFRDGDDLRIKRLDVIPNTVILLRSDNPKYLTEHRTGAAMNDISQNIVGQVVWSGHTWK